MIKSNILIVNSDDMAKHNTKISKTGKYYPPEYEKLTVGKRHWCLECKLYYLKKDMYSKDVCNECKEYLLKDGYHICQGNCGTFLFPKDKEQKCLFCEMLK